MATRDFWLKGAALLALCSGRLTPALAQPQPQAQAQPQAQRGRDDEGEFQILSARYGTPERNVDVTQRLRELARQDRSFVMGNDSFGVDPEPGRVKALRIFARGRDGQTRSFEYTERSTVDGALFTGWAGGGWGQGGPDRGPGSWGDTEAGRVQRRRDDEGDYVIQHARYGTARRNVDVTARLKELARRDRSFRATNEVLGSDPDPGATKALRIFATDARGGARTFEYVERSLVDGAQFKAWGAASWGGGSGNWSGGPAELKILRASYGVGGRAGDVAAALRARVRNGRLELEVLNGNLGGIDPAPGRNKTLTVDYTLGGGAPRQARVAEYGWLRLP